MFYNTQNILGFTRQSQRDFGAWAVIMKKDAKETARYKQNRV